MKLISTLIFFTISIVCFAQVKKGQSIYKTFNFSTSIKENFVESTYPLPTTNRAKSYIVKTLKPQIIGHINPSPFIAFSCWWAERKYSKTNTTLHIRYATKKNNWGAWQNIEIDGHNVNRNNKNYSTLSFIDSNLFYYQIKVETNKDAKGEQIESLFLNFFDPSKSIGLNKIKANEYNRPEQTESCPCPQPAYVSRVQWNCPQGQGMAPGVVTNPAVTHLIVHHSAGGNTSTNWNAVVLSIWNFHTGTNGYSDIGYNWLVAPDGTLYEGRGSNSSTANVQGAHFCGFNQATMGTCMIGTYTLVDVTLAARAKLTQILAWKSCQAAIPPIGTALHASSGVVLNRISGHRDGCATDCPGTTFYGTLPQLRNVVDAYVSACAVVPPCVASFNITQSGCPSNSLTFTPANVINGGIAPTFAWYVNNVFTQNGNTFTLANATNTTKVFARITSNAACNPPQANSDTLTINCVAPPPPPVCAASFNITQSGCPSNTLTFTPANVINGGIAPTFAWFVNSVFTQNGNTFTIANANNTTKVFARITSNAACNPPQANSDTFTINCVAPPIIPVSNIEYFTISPNPSNGYFTVKIYRNQPTTLQYRLLDASGKQILLTTKENVVGLVSKNFNKTKLANGIYTLIVYFNGKKEVKQIYVSE